MIREKDPSYIISSLTRLSFHPHNDAMPCDAMHPPLLQLLSASLRSPASNTYNNLSIRDEIFSQSRVDRLIDTYCR